MTNEEKAREIGRNIGIHTDAYYGALQMAQWKDEQYKKEKQQMIENACEWLNGYLFYLDKKDDIINNFEQSMKGE